MVEEKESNRGESNKTECLETTYLMVCVCVCVYSNNPCLFYDTCCPSLSFSFGLSEVLSVFELKGAFVALDLYYFDSRSVHLRIYCGSCLRNQCLGPVSA